MMRKRCDVVSGGMGMRERVEWDPVNHGPRKRSSSADILIEKGFCVSVSSPAGNPADAVAPQGARKYLGVLQVCIGLTVHV
eukprot:scaffold5980_cov192-Amphora_coffeaeformis.AAC.5